MKTESVLSDRAVLSEDLQTALPGCHCEACDPIRAEIVDGHLHSPNMRMIVCSMCGNKRCPHATDHRNACTNSNEIGQKGSSWEHVPRFAERVEPVAGPITQSDPK